MVYIQSSRQGLHSDTLSSRKQLNKQKTSQTTKHIKKEKQNKTRKKQSKERIVSLDLLYHHMLLEVYPQLKRES